MLTFNIEKQTTWKFENETSHFSLHCYEDDPKSIYLFSLFVEVKYRRQGLGNAILEYAEEFAKKRNFTTIQLKVERGSWMEYWYERRGYIFNKREENFHWMIKDLTLSQLEKRTEKKVEDNCPQQFSKGDIIVWHDRTDKEKSVLCWMIISGFDYPSDRAARARIGKSYNQYSYNSSVIYGGWCPNNFGEDVRLANDEEIGSILIELSNYYQHGFKEGIGEEILKLDLHGFRDDLYEKILEMME